VPRSFKGATRGATGRRNPASIVESATKAGRMRTMGQVTGAIDLSKGSNSGDVSRLSGDRRDLSGSGPWGVRWSDGTAPRHGCARGAHLWVEGTSTRRGSGAMHRGNACKTPSARQVEFTLTRRSATRRTASVRQLVCSRSGNGEAGLEALPPPCMPQASRTRAPHTGGTCLGISGHLRVRRSEPEAFPHGDHGRL